MNAVSDAVPGYDRYKFIKSHRKALRKQGFFAKMKSVLIELDVILLLDML